MDPVTLGLIMGGTSLLNMYREKQKQKATERYNKGQAEITRYSPWTGMKGQLEMNNPDYIGAGVQGAMGGAMMGQSLGAGGGAPLTGAESAAVNQSVGGMGAQAQNQGLWSTMNWQQQAGGPSYA